MSPERRTRSRGCRRDRRPAQAPYRLAFGSFARDRRQAAQDELEVGHDHRADRSERLGHSAGAVRREQQALDGARGVVGGDRLARPDVDRRAQAPRGRELDERVDVGDGGAAHEQQRGALGQQLELAPAEHRPVLGGRRGEDEDDARGAQQLVEPARLGAGVADDELGQPRVVGAHAAAERREQAHELAPEVAQADDADVGAGEQEAAAIALKLVGLGARAHRAVGGGDPAHEVDRHAQRRLRDGGRERAARAEHVDAARKARVVVDVGQEVALDVDDGAQLGGALDAPGVEVGLADDRHGLGQVGLDDLRRHPARAFMHDELAEGLEPRARRRVEHHVHGARTRIDEDRRHLRIVDVALFYGERSGGIRTYLDAKAAHARATGAFEHHVVVPGPRERHEGGRHEVPGLRLAAANGYRVPLGARALGRTLERLRPDVVLLHDPFWLPLRVTELAHALGAKVVAVHHGSAALDAAGMRGPTAAWTALFRAWLRHAYAPVDAIASVVDPEPDCGRPASFRLRLGLHDAFRPQHVAQGDHVLYAGRLAREKGVFQLLEATARATEPWPLRLVGSGPAEDQLRRRARALGIDHRVAFRPFIQDRARLARAYAGARCVVMPGEHETFGLVALEAAASGARVVACETAPSAALIGPTAHTYAPGDVDGLAAAIARARAAPPDPVAAAALSWRSRWDRVFADELDDLRALVA